MPLRRALVYWAVGVVLWQADAPGYSDRILRRLPTQRPEPDHSW